MKVHQQHDHDNAYQSAANIDSTQTDAGISLSPPPIQLFSTRQQHEHNTEDQEIGEHDSEDFVLQRAEDHVDNSSSPTNPSEGEVEECNMSDAELEQFMNTSSFGPQNLAPPTGGGGSGFGGFEATYTHSNGAGQLHIAVRAKINLVNGLEFDGSNVTAGDPEFDQLAILMNSSLTPVQMAQFIPYYQYTAEERAEGLATFQERLVEAMEIWNNTAYSFYVHKPCWEDVTSTVHVSVTATEGDAQYQPGAANESSNDHLQITVIKDPPPNLQSTIQSQLEEMAQMSIDFDQVNTDIRAFVAPGDDQNPFDSSMILSSNDLNWSQNGDPSQGHLTYQVFFDHDSDALSDRYQRRLDAFISTFEDSSTNEISNPVQLIGHASSSGSSEYNQGLVQRRLNAVSAYLHDNGFQNVVTRVSQDNQSDRVAESRPNTPDHAWDRRVDIIVGSGEMQNVLAHELGHVFGLDDEYIEDRGSGTRDLGQNTDHNDLAGEIGANPSTFEHNDSLMSMGNEVRSMHMATFGWALKEITNVQEWKIRS